MGNPVLQSQFISHLFKVIEKKLYLPQNFIQISKKLRGF
jgi:hypothetical protein